MPDVGPIRPHDESRTGSRRSELRSRWMRGAGPSPASLAIACILFLATVAASRPTPPKDLIKPAFDPKAVRERLAVVDSADVSRACGNLSRPWAYRGPAGREMSLRSYGRHHAGPDWAQDLARRLTQEATLDTVRGVRTARVACEPGEGAPAYLVRFHSGERSTFALFLFLDDAILLFDAEEPLASIRMHVQADTLWARLAALLVDDPLLRGPRLGPSAAGPLRDPVDPIYAEELPEAMERVAPNYPEAARAAGISGTVWVQALVGKDGRIRDAIVLAGPTQLRDAALEAIWQWGFRPARAKKQPIPVWVAIPVKFTLR